MLIWLWTMETFASSVSCWLANREGESTNMWNCKKGKFYYLEQIMKTTETGKVLTCESERSKQLKSESFTLGTDQYKNIPLSSVTTVSSNHANVSPWRPLPREFQSPFLQFIVGDAVLCELNNLNYLSTQGKNFRLNFNSSLHWLKNIIFRSFTSEM